MQLLQALLGLAVLPAAFAKPTPHSHQLQYRDESRSDQLETRQALKHKPYCMNRGAHLVVTSGHGATSSNGQGLLNTTSAAILAAIPYSNLMVTYYDKNNTNIQTGIASGVTNLTAHIEWYTAGCPNTPIILLGYSEGGIATMNTLCGRSDTGGTTAGIAQSYSQYIAATVLYGEETRVAGESWNAGTCTTGSGLDPRLNPSACGVFGNNIRSWCDMNDPECCTTQSPNANQSIHYVYPSEYNSAATSFAVSKFKAWKANRAAATSSTA